MEGINQLEGKSHNFLKGSKKKKWKNVKKIIVKYFRSKYCLHKLLLLYMQHFLFTLHISIAQKTNHMRNVQKIARGEKRITNCRHISTKWLQNGWKGNWGNFMDTILQMKETNQ